MQKIVLDFWQLFRDQAVAPLNLPPLAEFETFLPSRLRGARDPASTFLQAGFAWVPPGPSVPPGPRLADPQSRVKRSGSGASCWVWEVGDLLEPTSCSFG